MSRRAAGVTGYVGATVARRARGDVFFSNAGNAGAIAPVDAHSDDAFDDVYRVHVQGAWRARTKVLLSSEVVT
jgi:NAD(P)-dependent dehydrogenase (short-subunit alcohol dehydrogenase family)